MNKKAIFAAGAVFIVLAAVFIAFIFNDSSHKAASPDIIPTSTLQASFIINPDNKPELVGDADYVFVGSVVSKDGTEYKHPVMGETEDGEAIEINSPYTNYTVSVIKNIKGQLVTDRDIPVQKSGGLAQDASQYLLYEQDELPEAGGVYIFYAYTQPDGSLLVSGPNSNQKLNIAASFTDRLADDSIEDSAEVQEVVDALKMQVERNRERFISTYDVSKRN